METKNIGNNENIKLKNEKSTQKVDCNDEKGIKDVKEAAAAAVNIRDKMIKYRINLSNFKSIIKQQKQLQQATFCVSPSYYTHTINTTTFITINTKNTFTTTNNSSSTTRTTIDITTNFTNLFNIYQENLILVVLSASSSVNIRNTTPQLTQEPPKILLLLLNDKTIQKLFNNNTKTKKSTIKLSFSIPNTNAFLKIFEIPSGKRIQEINQHCCYAENNISINDNNISCKIENQKIIFKNLRLPFAILLSPQLLTPLLEETNEPLPKFLCLSPFCKTRNTMCNGFSDVVIVLKFLIVILIRIIDFFFNFVNYYHSVLFSKSLLLFLLYYKYTNNYKDFKDISIQVYMFIIQII
ncbi:hypothetical protein DOY81_011388 [Sarcophaga bullata]|nr:hypothetical protein DOY81_011388 [Sarcophaga bullata]